MSDAVIINGQGRFQRVRGEVSSPDLLVGSASLLILVKSIGDVLERHFGGWRWGIRADEHGGIVDILSMRISGKYGYTLHIPRIQSDTQMKCVLMAGGEVLERFGFRRVPYSYEEWRRREQVHGQFIPDVSDQPIRMRREVRTETIQTGLANGTIRIATNPSIGRAIEHRDRMLKAGISVVK